MADSMKYSVYLSGFLVIYDRLLFFALKTFLHNILLISQIMTLLMKRVLWEKRVQVADAGCKKILKALFFPIC
jgi:hypothetical protein